MPLWFFQSIQINLTKVQTIEPFAKFYLPLFVCFTRSMDHHPIFLVLASGRMKTAARWKPLVQLTGGG